MRTKQNKNVRGAQVDEPPDRGNLKSGHAIKKKSLPKLLFLSTLFSF